MQDRGIEDLVKFINDGDQKESAQFYALGYVNLIGYGTSGFVSFKGKMELKCLGNKCYIVDHNEKPSAFSFTFKTREKVKSDRYGSIRQIVIPLDVNENAAIYLRGLENIRF